MLCLIYSKLSDYNSNKSVGCVWSGYTEELDKNSEIVVPDDDHGLYAIDILDPSLVRTKMF